MFARWRNEIAGILDERYYPLEWVEAQIARGKIALLESENAVIGVERRDYPGGAVELHGMFAAGDMQEIGKLVDQVCEAAAFMGCTIAAIESRPGWARAFKNRGFEMEQVRIVKELRDGP